MPKRKDKLDPVDADHIRRVTESRGWQLIRQRVERTLELKVAELQQPLDPVKTAEVRGMIQGLRLALDVPRILRAEGKEVNEDSAADGN